MKALRRICSFLHFTPGERKIMGLLDDVKASQEATLAKVTAISESVIALDQSVEALFDQIKQLTGDGITKEAADALLANEAKIDAALDSLATGVAAAATDD